MYGYFKKYMHERASCLLLADVDPMRRPPFASSSEETSTFIMYIYVFNAQATFFSLIGYFCSHGF